MLGDLRKRRYPAIGFSSIYHPNQDSCQLTDKLENGCVLLHPSPLVLLVPSFEVGMMTNQTEYAEVEMFPQGAVATFGQFDLSFKFA